MIATLIRQDPAFRRLPFWIVMSSVWASAAAGVVAWIGARGDAVGIELLAALIWVSVALYLFFGETCTRTNRFNMSLPISALELWRAHVIAVALTGLVTLVVSATVTTATLALIGRLIEGWSFELGPLVELGSLLLAGLALAIGIVHAFRPDAQEVPLSLARVGWSLMAAAVPLGLLLAVRHLGVVGVLMVGGLAAALFFRVSRMIPESLSVPAKTSPGPARTSTDAAGPESWTVTQRPVGLWFALRTAHGATTCAKKSFAIWLIVAFLLFLGFWVSGIDAREDPSTQRFAYPFMIVYVLMAATTMSIGGLGAIDWLPWSRRRLAALVVVPLFFAVAAGYGIGRLVDTLLGPSRSELLCFMANKDTGEPQLCVLPNACEISWNGDVPEITTSWGETRIPWSEPVVKGLPVRVYFPYSVPPGSSAEFAGLQISRAAAALFGADIPPGEIRTRYLDASDGSLPALTLRADYPDLREFGRGAYFPWIMAIVVGLWSLLTAGYVGWLRGGVSQRKRKVMAAVFIAIPMLLWVLDFVLEASGVSEIFVRNAFLGNLVKAASSTPGGVVFLWAGSAMVAWAAYRLFERRFDKAELGTEPAAGHGCSF